MKHIINTGTDVATLCFFDPDALPEDLDFKIKEDRAAVCSVLVQEGRIGWIDYDSDGGYIFHFYVNEPVPPQLLEHAPHPQRIEKLLVPGGRIWVCGAEFLKKVPSQGGLRKHPHMGGSFALKPGEYQTTIWQPEWPEDASERALRVKAGAESSAHEKLIGTITGLLVATIIFGGFALVFATLVILEKTGELPMWQQLAWCYILAAIIACGFLFRRLKRLESNSLRKEVEAEFPSFVVQLQSIR